MSETKRIEIAKGISLEMVRIPAGKFVMGSPEYEEGRFENETQHLVVISKPFYLGKFPVTQKQWEAIMDVNPSCTKGPNLPLHNVSWDQCQSFITKLNKLTCGGGFRLPTEAEWEYACRAETTTAFSFGDKIRKEDANFNSSESGMPSIGQPSEVGKFKPNNFGLYDMHGNVNEYCQDWHGEYPWGCVTDPPGRETGKYRVVRGGTFTVFGLGIRSAIRFKKEQAKTHFDIGFRLAMTE